MIETIIKKNFFFFALLSLAALIYSWKREAQRIEFSPRHKVVEFHLNQVKLLPGPFLEAQQRDLHYLLSLQPRRLLTYFRTTAGLDSLFPAYKGWEGGELRGHFSGHFLSACALMYAATGDERLKQQTDIMVAGLEECQRANKDGYISAFPRSFIDRVEKNEKVWAPYYTIHKILAGLLDVYTYCNNESALQVAARMADWIDRRMAALSYRQIQHMLDSTEQGGMNEVLYNLYEHTGKEKYKMLAKKFYQESYFRPLAKRIDSLKGQHSNSFIPNVVGIARGYELTGDTAYKGMAIFFWNQVVKGRSYVTGGTSNGEHWGSLPFNLSKELGPASHETCCTYNMLKLTRHLFIWDPKAEYAAYYERALWNGILPTQEPKSGMTMYYVPMASGYYKTFSTSETSFWCCTGSGVENFALTGKGIYYGKGDSLFVNQFIASQLSLPEKGFALRQETSFPQKQENSFTFQLNKPSLATILLRIPEWIKKPFILKVNGKPVTFQSKNGYAAIKRIWKEGDKLVMTLPMDLHMESLVGDNNRVALLYGPIVLSGALSDTGLTEKKQFGHYGPYNDKPVDVPAFQGSKNELQKWIKPVPDKPLTFSVATTKGDVTFLPFYQLFGWRYMIYGSFAEDKPVTQKTKASTNNTNQNE